MDAPEYYEVELGRDTLVSLPLVKINDNLSVYSFNLMGETQWIEVCAKSLVKLLKAKLDKYGDNFEIVTIEAKSLCLANEISKLLHKSKHYVVRKSKKAYMVNPIELQVKSITTDHIQNLYLDQNDINNLRGKNIVYIDDVISTGGSANSMIELSKMVGFNIINIACVLDEGDTLECSENKHFKYYKGIPCIILDHIPLITNKINKEGT